MINVVLHVRDFETIMVGRFKYEDVRAFVLFIFPATTIILQGGIDCYVRNRKYERE